MGIVERLASDEVGIEDFDPTDVERVRNMIMITDEQYEKLLADGYIKSEDVDSERAKNQAETGRILDLARMTTYQLSNSQRRRVEVYYPEDLYNALYEVVDSDGGIAADDMIRLEIEGRHRIIFVSKSALDYVAIPTHKLKQGRVEAAAEDLDRRP